MELHAALLGGGKLASLRCTVGKLEHRLSSKLCQKGTSVRVAAIAAPDRHTADRAAAEQRSDTHAAASAGPQMLLETPAQAAPLRTPPVTSTVGASARPPVSALAPDANADTVLNTNPNRLGLMDLIGNDGGPPRFSTPFVPGARSSLTDPTKLPYLLYLPGIDGTGLAAYRQFPSLLKAFDLCCFVIPGHDRTFFPRLVEIVEEFLEEQVGSFPPERPVYLLGESFGGILALAVAAARPDLVDRVVLVNPATSYLRTQWSNLGPLLSSLPPEVYSAVPVALAPVLGNPLALASFGINRNASLSDQAAAFGQGLQALVPQLTALADILPPATLAWKLQLLRQGALFVEDKLGSVPQRVLLLIGDADLLLPSADEGRRLSKALPRCHLKVLRGRAHALLQEAGVDLVDILHQEGFYVPMRRLSASLKKRSKLGFGSGWPIELPTDTELERASEQTTKLLRQVVSPIFLSTDETGRVQHGLSALPEGRPVLFVGNHQTFALDTFLMVGELLRQKGVMLRGLAHPVVFQGFATEAQSAGDSQNGFSSFMATYGAVPVGGRNFYRLLQNREAVLLYPGGVREAYKGKGEEYRLFWPREAEFVRMAAKFGAVIVPFAGVGAEDGIRMLLDSSELQRIPLLGDLLRRRASDIPQARRGVKGSAEEQEMFLQPLALPVAPERYYYLFQKPIQLSPEDLKVEGRCEELYRQVQQQVEGGISWLRRKRVSDPYASLPLRLLYEASWGGKQAPTFPLAP